MSRVYKLIAGSAPQAFHHSRAKVRLYAGGFANGKTTALCIETLQILRDYPGVSAMLARNTFANLEKTLGREFYKWCPPNWIKSGTIRGGTAHLVNGSTVDFRYLSQQSNASGDSSSNLLSANYGLIVVDQVEDPDITEKDFDDMLGRLREQVPLDPNGDQTMPKTGPRMMLLSANPSLGWVYTKLVKPVHDMRAGIWNDDLLCVRNPNTGEPVLDANGHVQPLIEIFEASTYDNAQNLEADFLQLLESKYRGKMRDRYILGKWVAFDGVVYDEYDPTIHRVPDNFIRNHISSLRVSGQQLGVLEGYDLGITSPSCYAHAWVDYWGNVFVTDGFYEPNLGIIEQANKIKQIRRKNGHDPEDMTAEVNADPQIFKTTSVNAHNIGKSAAMLFREEGVAMRRANNQIMPGILNVKQYLAIQKSVINPFTGELGSPKIFFSDKLSWMHDEMTTWRWKKNRNDESIDSPVDGDDHAMDMLKYMLSGTVRKGKTVARRQYKVPTKLLQWSEGPDSDDTTNRKQHRYG